MLGVGWLCAHGKDTQTDSLVERRFGCASRLVVHRRDRAELRTTSGSRREASRHCIHSGAVHFYTWQTVDTFDWLAWIFLSFLLVSVFMR